MYSFILKQFNSNRIQLFGLSISIILFLFSCNSQEYIVSETFEDGSIKVEMYAKNGDIIKIIEYFNNGNIKAIVNRKNGKLHGKSIVFDIDGNIVRQFYYHEGIEGKPINGSVKG